MVDEERGTEMLSIDLHHSASRLQMERDQSSLLWFLPPHFPATMDSIPWDNKSKLCLFSFLPSVCPSLFSSFLLFFLPSITVAGHIGVAAKALIRCPITQSSLSLSLQCQCSWNPHQSQHKQSSHLRAMPYHTGG